jgi:hypothetical protein
LTFFSFYLAVAYCVLALIGIAITRKSVIPGLIAFALLPAIAYFLKFDPQSLAAISVLASIILTAHYRNVIQEINQLFARQPNAAAASKAESTKS